MYGKVTCKECDLIISHLVFKRDETMPIQILRRSMLEHGKLQGHILLKLTIIPDRKDLKGDLNHV